MRCLGLSVNAVLIRILFIVFLPIVKNQSRVSILVKVMSLCLVEVIFFFFFHFSEIQLWYFNSQKFSKSKGFVIKKKIKKKMQLLVHMLRCFF